LPEILNEINWLDILFVILLLGMVYKGLRVGVGGQIPSLIGGFVLLYVAVTYYGFVSEAIFGFLLQKWTKAVAFLIISGGIFVTIKILERLLSVLGNEEFAPLERLAGGLIAVFRTFILCGIVGMFLLLVPVESIKTSIVDQSKTCMFFVEFDLRIYNWMHSIINSGEKAEEIEPVNVDQFMIDGK